MTDKGDRESNNSDQTDSDDDIEYKDKFKERELKESSPPFLSVMYNVDGPNISPSEIVNIVPRERERVKFLFLLLWDLIEKHLCFLKTILQEETIPMRKEKLKFSGGMNVSSLRSIINVKNIAGR